MIDIVVTGWSKCAALRGELLYVVCFNFAGAVKIGALTGCVITAVVIGALAGCVVAAVAIGALGGCVNVVVIGVFAGCTTALVVTGTCVGCTVRGVCVGFWTVLGGVCPTTGFLNTSMTTVLVPSAV
jgi:hypothetical protein